MGILNSIGSALNSINSIVNWIKEVISKVSGVFSDVDFSVLYSWLPSDIAGVISAIIVVLLFLALFGLVRKILFFIG